MNVKERIAYVRGLIEGSEFCGKDAQAKNVWDNLLRICDDLASELNDVSEGQEELEEYVEAIDSDLSDLEGDIYDEDDDDECGCASCAPDDDAAEPVVEMECPKCGEDVVFEEGFLYDADVEVTCPECGATVYATGAAAPDSEIDGDVEKGSED